MEEKNLENLKKTHGGARVGSGRKLQLKATARDLFYTKVDERWDEILKVLDHYIAKKDKEMVKYLIDQRMGKAPQRLEMTGNEGNPIQIQIVRYGETTGNSNDTPAQVARPSDIRTEQVCGDDSGSAERKDS